MDGFPCACCVLYRPKGGALGLFLCLLQVELENNVNLDMSFREQFGNLMTGAYKGDAPSFGDLMTGAYKGDTPSFGDLMTGGKKIDADDFLKLFTQRENEPFMVAHHMNPNVTDG